MGKRWMPGFEQLHAEGCTKIYRDKASGARTEVPSRKWLKLRVV
jgi:hypothetical protein